MQISTPNAATNQPLRDQAHMVKGEFYFAQRSSDEAAKVLPGAWVPLINYEVDIRNARPISYKLSLDKEGFILARHKTSYANERDPQIFRDKYLEEMIPFIKDRFNASWVVARRDGVAVRSAGGGAVSGIEKTARTAHIDYAPVSGPRLAAIEDRLQNIETRPYSRLMIIQAWRALSPPPQDDCLAFCDRSTVLDDDIVMAHYFEPRSSAEYKTLHLYFNPNQLWYYFPEMTPDEVILFKGYDSETHCNPSAAHLASSAAHSGFDNRRAYPNANRRESVEARFFVYYE